MVVCFYIVMLVFFIFSGGIPLLWFDDGPLIQTYTPSKDLRKIIEPPKEGSQKEVF